MNREDFWDLRPGLLGVLDCLRITATMFGYPLVGMGWFLFTLALSASVDGPPSFEGTSLFVICAYLIVPGWLLLRFGAGLFPFGRRLYRR